jgi:hypothetical protein
MIDKFKNTKESTIFNRFLKNNLGLLKGYFTFKILFCVIQICLFEIQISGLVFLWVNLSFNKINLGSGQPISSCFKLGRN